MKRILLASAFFALVLTLLLTGVGRQTGIVSAQNKTASADDQRLAAEIKRVTDRSGEGLTQRPTLNGGVVMELGETFQNVMLARMGNDGEPVAACITSLGEANDFLGRDLETGATIVSRNPANSEIDKLAAKHGMSTQEYEYYAKMIADAAAIRAASPNAATLNIVNADGTGEGFNDATAATPEGGNTGATRGEQRLQLFNFAAAIWGSFLDSSVPIDVRSQFNSLTPCTTSGGVLGSAGTQFINRDFTNAGLAGTWYHGALANKIEGADANGATQEINAQFNSDVDNGCLGAGSRFYYGLNNTTPSQRINLLIVLLHEMGHGLGFSSFASGSTGALNGGFPDVYTRYMFDRTTSKYWYQMTNAERQASALNNGNVLWDGPNVKSASAFLTAGRDTSGRVQLYTPATFASGSSVSHFDTAASPSLLMEPNITSGLPLDLDLTKQQMRDIGWYRDTTADLIPDTITSVTPSGGTLVIGSTRTISWANTGGFNKNVTIDLSLDGGATFPTTLATNIANTGTFSFTVPNTPTSVGRIRVRENGFVDPAGSSAAPFSISSTAPVARTPFDFDGDAKTDLSIFRPSAGQWWLSRSSDGASRVFQFGASTDRLVPADFTGDGKTDVAFFRPSTGEWYILRSEDSSFYAFPFGGNGDVPVPADYDGDGRSDAAVFRESNLTWYINKSSGGTTITGFGAAGDLAVPADYDGDGKADIAIYRPNAVGGAQWWIQRSTTGAVTALQFGTSTDKTVPGDYTGDGKADVAIWRPSTGAWSILRSEDFSFYAFPFGAVGDVPSPGDYDGDGRFDAAVFRPSNSTWFANRSTAGVLIQQFGTTGDLPLPNVYVK